MHVDRNGSIGRASSPGKIQVQTLHVQSRGVFQLISDYKSHQFQLKATNISVNIPINVCSAKRFELNW